MTLDDVLGSKPVPPFAPPRLVNLMGEWEVQVREMTPGRIAQIRGLIERNRRGRKQ